MQTALIRSDADVPRAVAMTVAVARRAGLDPRRVSVISTAVSELARNIVKYAGSGKLSVETIEEGGRRGLRVIAQDRGPGISDVEAALRDHYSTGGTLGLGLPGVRRLMDDLRIESLAGRGTTVTAVLWISQGTGPSPEAQREAGSMVRGSPFARTYVLPPGTADVADRVVAAARVRPHRSERLSGDAVVLGWIQDRVLVALIDALGHGPRAAQIAEKATQALRGVARADVLLAIDAVDQALRQSDGAAIGVVVVDPRDGRYEAAAVGNVSVRVIGGNDLRLDWTEGTVGATYRRPAVRSGNLGPGVLVLYSDGISDRFTGADYPGVASDEPSVASRSIVDRFGKDYDDAACVVLRWR